MAAKVSHLGLLLQGQVELDIGVVDMVARIEAENFGSCSNYRECEVA
jgi:succinate dehydrogenase / fumarate reductase iron-sulfur subunit